MSTKIKLLLLAVAIFALAIGQVQAATVTVPNADFETIYKPDSTTITATLSSGGWTQGVGPDCPIDSGQYNFSDQTSGSSADIPGWIGYDKAGWIAWGGTYGRNQTTGNLQGSVSTGNNHTSGGLNCYLVNGGSWGNSAGGLIVSDAFLGNIMSGCTYTLSMYAKGAATPVVLKLLANGTVITPSSSVSPTLSSSWQEFSRTYDYDDLTSYVGQALTIVCGVDRDTSGTQTQMDDVSLEYSTTCPPALVLPPVTGCDGLVLTDASSIDTKSAGITTNSGEGVGGTDSTTVGDGEYIDILDSGCFQLGKDGSDFALSFWLKATGPTQIIGTKTQYNGNQGFLVFVDGDSKICAISSEGSGNTTVSSTPIQLNEWTHVVINYKNGDDSTFEVNVNLAETSGYAYEDVYNSNLRIGDEGWGSISSFDVCIFQSWGRVLTRNEIKALYFDKASDLGLSSAILSSVMSEIMDHLTGTTPLTGPEIEALTETFVENGRFLDENVTIITEAFALIDYYETNEGPLFINEETDGGFPRVQGGSDGYELARAIFTIQQEIHDRVFDAENCQDCQAMLDGKMFATSEFFPGECDPPTNPETVYEVDINGSNPAMWGKPVCYGPIPARRPTGLYLAPGSIGEVTAPSAMVNQGFEILVGGHAVDKLKYYKSTLQRFDRVSKSFPITSTVTSIANPFGGGVYIMVPYEADLGTQTVEISNVVQSPYFAATSTKQTTLQEWTDTERHHPGPWADFESDKFMMTVPTSWIYNYADPVTQMQDWDLAMDGVSELLGYVSPYNVRNLPVLYVEPDLSIQHGAYGTGYPQINNEYNPDAPTNGNSSHFWLTNVIGWSTEFHELSHCQLFSKFPGHEEATVNLPYVYVAAEKFGVPLVDAFTDSMQLAYLENIDVDQAALTWFVTENFRNGNPMDITNSEYNEVRYQHRGYGRYVDIGELFGWDVISDFYYQEHLDYIDPPPSDGLGEVDSRIFRLSKAAGVDLTPLIHCWGVHPVNLSALQAAIEDAELPSSQVIHDRLVHYKDIIPANNDEFWDHYLTIYPSQPTGGNPLYQYGWYNVWKNIYDETHGTAAKAAMQNIIELYFSGSTPVTVPNADFETIYKPDSTTITATLSSGGWTQGVGPDCPIDSGQYNFSDQTSGSSADIPGWIGYDRDGWIAEGGTYGRNQTTGNLQGSVSTGNNHTSGGLNCYLANGGSWGNSAGGLIVSETSLGNVLTNATYTLSMYAKGAATPVVLKLLANGTVITPSSSVSPTLSGTFQEFSRTYDAEDLTSYVGQALTIVCGVDRDASGTQTQFDDISLTRCYEPALPAYVATGAVTSGTGTISPALPSGIAVNDILLLFVETANQAVSITNQNGGTWAAVTSSPQGTGTAGGTTATRLTVFWSRYNGTQGAPTVSDSGDHQLARMVAIRNAVSSGNPWNVTAGGVEATSDTSVSIPGATTTVANTLVVVATAGSLPDAIGREQFSAWTNANLTGLLERTDNSVDSGNGGSLGIATGIKATAGAYGNTTATRANSAVKGMISIAIKP